VPVMESRRSKIFGALLVLSALFSVSPAAAVSAADTYPNKPVRLIIPQPPGGGTDTIGRLIAAKLSENLGKQVFADNRGGAGGVLGTEMAAKAEPDGYTLLFVSGSYFTQPALEKLPYDSLKSFTPIAKVGVAIASLVVHPSLPANTVKELIALAKQKPGELIFGATGIGTTSHIGSELFKMMAGIDIKIVQFKGGGPAVIDLLGGHSHALFGTIVQNLPQIKSGKLKLLATTGLKRSVILPDAPTISETDLPGYELSQTYGILAPAGTPSSIVDRLNKELKEILMSDEVKKQFLNEGSEVDYLGAKEFSLAREKEINKWIGVVKKANIRLEP
jgi:tripartite-type tricarboxylate transporter receptor subunit TctC